MCAMTLKQENCSAPLVSVIIPVKNGMPLFAQVLQAVAKQKLSCEFEVIAIDSGSTDGSIEAVKKMDARFRLLEIAPSEFGHGRTRNYGVELAKGEFCAFLTHDALPVNEHWLHELIQPLLNDPDVAGVFGRHVAYPNANPYTKLELEQHFRGLKKWPVVEITDAREYARNIGLRKIYHFYSDNSSCLRKSCWNLYPYPDIDFAEDQLWAKTIVEQGYKKAYSHDSLVYHSHDYSLWERFQRSYDEARALNELFGYEYINTLSNAIKVYLLYTKKDLSTAVNNNFSQFPFTKVIHRLFYNFSKVFGLYIGTINPDFIKRRQNTISKDRQLRNIGINN